MGHPRRLVDPNITPLIDVLLVLLIIFLAALPLSQSGLDVAVPQDVQRPDTPAVSDHHIVLEYTADRQISINHQPVTLPELEQRLRDIYRGRQEKVLYVSGDGSLPYGRIVEVIDAAAGAGVVRVGVITEGMRAAQRAR